MFDNFALPMLTVNGYLWDIMKDVEPTLSVDYGELIPFFPVADSAAGSEMWKGKTYCIYDRMLRRTGDPFYVKKQDHILYYIKGEDIDVFQWSAAMQYILDRQDDAAKDINNWNAAQSTPARVRFHHFRVYQTDSGDMGSPIATRDYNNDAYFVSKFIVDVTYHLADPLEPMLSK